MKVSIIGAGNLAWHLAGALEQADMDVIEVYARSRKNAKALANTLYQTDATNSLDFSESEAEVFILAVSDDAIETVAQELILPEKCLLVHTSGSMPMNVLNVALSNNPECYLGVFYPLMTFTKGRAVNFAKIPICVEGSQKSAVNILSKLAASISREVYEVESGDRKVLHLAAVFSCNFTNHLLALAKEIMNEEGLNYDLLKPLISETIQKAMSSKHPAEVQTGPAVRRDNKSIEQHRDLIKADEDLLRVYDTLTTSIQDWHQNE